MRHGLDQMTSNLPTTLAVLSRGRMLSTLSSLDPPAASVVTHHAGCALPRGAVPFGPAEGGGGQASCVWWCNNRLMWEVIRAPQSTRLDLPCVTAARLFFLFPLSFTSATASHSPSPYRPRPRPHPSHSPPASPPARPVDCHCTISASLFAMSLAPK